MLWWEVRPRRCPGCMPRKSMTSREQSSGWWRGGRSLTARRCGRGRPDRLLRPASHTNGYSLARAVLSKHFGIDSAIDELGTTLADALLAVHRSYLPTIHSASIGSLIHALSRHGRRDRREHHAGRAEGPAAPHRLGRKRPPIFTLIQRLGEVPEEDMQ
ncbi:MAG: hypothetical protein MZV64_16735 [Ignavibacteriales bacterium]|nr:hypothetical protein [Ignavibacteriales bacterium]